jgi:hypothetical protein
VMGQGSYMTGRSQVTGDHETISVIQAWTRVSVTTSWVDLLGLYTKPPDFCVHENYSSLFRHNHQSKPINESEDENGEPLPKLQVLESRCSSRKILKIAVRWEFAAFFRSNFR